jgi:hypothetical protein
VCITGHGNDIGRNEWSEKDIQNEMTGTQVYFQNRRME